MGEVYFVMMPALINDSGLNWTAIGVCVSMCIGTIGILGLLTTWIKNYFDGRYKRSLFYLDQIKSYFTKSISLLSEGENNNVKWHQAIEALKTADDLSRLLTDKSHQRIYVNEYMDTAYRVIDVIKDVDDFKFFYGLSEYKDIASSNLYHQSNPLSLDKPHFRISPETLLCLCKFIDKANRVFYDSNQNKMSSYEIFKSDYFNVNLSDHKSITEFTKISMKVVFEYLEDFNMHKMSKVNV